MRTMKITEVLRLQRNTTQAYQQSGFEERSGFGSRAGNRKSTQQKKARASIAGLRANTGRHQRSGTPFGHGRAAGPSALCVPCERSPCSTISKYSSGCLPPIEDPTYDLLRPLLPLRDRGGSPLPADRPSERRRANIVSRAFCKALR